MATESNISISTLSQKETCRLYCEDHDFCRNYREHDDMDTQCEICGKPLDFIYDSNAISIAICKICNHGHETVHYTVPDDCISTPRPYCHDSQRPDGDPCTSHRQCYDMSGYIPGTYHADLDTTPKPCSDPTYTHRARTDFSYSTLADIENRTTLSVTIPGSRKRKYTPEEKATAARERARQEAAAYVQNIPEHKQIMADIAAGGEGIEGLAAYLGGKPDVMHAWERAGAPQLVRQLIEDCHVGLTGDVMRNTGIDRDPRPQHLCPLSVMKNWKVDAPTAERITEALKMLGATAAIAKHYQVAYAADPIALVELEMIAGQLEADVIPDTDALSKAARFYEDSNADAPADDEPEPDPVDYHGADGGFVQFVNMDDERDADYHDNQGSIRPSHPACPWSLKQPKHVQTIGRALRTATTQDALKAACTQLIEAKVSPIQGKVLWGIYFRTRDRLHIAKFGQPSAKAKKFQTRLTNPGSAPINFAAAAVAIHQLGPGDRNYLTPVLYKAQRQHKAQAARA